MKYHNLWKVIRRGTESWKCGNTEEWTDWNATTIDVTKQERTWGNVCFCTLAFHLEYVNDGLPQASADYFAVRLRAHSSDDIYELPWAKKDANYYFENDFDSTFFQPEPEGDLSSLPEEAPEQRVKIKMMLNFTGYDNMIENFSLQQLIWRWEWSRIWSKQYSSSLQRLICRLAGVPPEGHSWSRKATAALRDLVAEDEVFVVIINVVVVVFVFLVFL